MISKKFAFFFSLALPFGSLFSGDESCKEILSNLLNNMYSIAKTNRNGVDAIENELFQAAEKIKRLFEAASAGESGHSCTGDDFLMAAAYGNREILQYFVNAGFDINYTDEEGKNPILMAYLSSNLDTMKYLAELDVDFAFKYRQDLSDQCWLLSDSDLEVSFEMMHFIIKTQDIQFVRNNENGHRSSFCNYESCKEILENLLESSYFIAKTNRKGGQEIEYEIVKATEKIRKLFKAVADESRIKIFCRAKDFLMVAGIGNREMLQEFIRVGLDVNYRDENGRTPFCMAAQTGNEDNAKYLYECGADAEISERDLKINFDELVLLLQIQDINFVRSGKYGTTVAEKS